MLDDQGLRQLDVVCNIGAGAPMARWAAESIKIMLPGITLLFATVLLNYQPDHTVQYSPLTEFLHC
jgi:hypothetical protein